MAEELKDDALDEVSGGILGIDEQKIFEAWKSRMKVNNPRLKSRACKPVVD